MKRDKVKEERERNESSAIERRSETEKICGQKQ